MRDVEWNAHACVGVGLTYMCEGNQKTHFWIQVFPFIFLWVPENELRLFSGINSGCVSSDEMSCWAQKETVCWYPIISLWRDRLTEASNSQATGNTMFVVCLL